MAGGTVEGRVIIERTLRLSISKRLPYKVQPRLSSNSWAGVGGLARQMASGQVYALE